ncbi:amidase [Kineococcus rhizosphaerae]|uniref:Aspartyl-tRNA(Asn)/glutamyl-tRNA(Gln) amidotransferase subunit A n=1 Tax=Kineococcus rhizosphaerae TaxID=559628 RepID=A0A2T0R3Q3_9ACTN|nr:amidase family protein [Kineococcus rhizosphaerae]PRY14640.1 aspartyl-tRNA(Asn)/glutamyl-tRNA(Gln) amidotransferase subunit A [Kineococcus rhizosphaerae]
MSEPTTLDELTRLPATDLARLVRERTVSAAEVTDAALSRIEELDATLHAFVELTADAAREQAAAVDAALARGERVGPLAGVPLAVKDLIATRGVRNRNGSPAYLDFVPDEDDIVVERARAAGAVLLGQTTVPEFGYSAVADNPVSPTTRNPWNPDLTPGGSSAGSAVAVATGMAPLAFGSDGGGSIRIPAAHCGLYGIKASMGRVPLYPGTRDERYPGISSWESLEHVGPLTRTVADAALLLSVVAGPDPRDRHSIPCLDVDWTAAAAGGPVAGLRVAYSPDLGHLPVDPRVREVVERAVGVFADLGAHVEEAGPDLGDAGDAFWAMVAAETDLRGMRALAREHPDTSPHLRALLDHPWTAEDFTDALVTRKRVVNRMWRFMAGYDLLLTPTLAVPPFGLGVQGPTEIDGRTVADNAWLGFVNPMNMTGQPAASVPAGFTADGLPVGLQIVGPHLGDAAVLRASAAFEAAAPWAQHWPALLGRAAEPAGVTA